MLTKEEFFNEVTGSIRDYLPQDMQDAEISFKKVVKTNDIVKGGLTVRKPGEVVAPTFYLDDFYNLYEQGSKLENLIASVANCFKNAEKLKPKIGDRDITKFDFENIKDWVVFEVVYAPTNEERLKHILSEPLLGNYRLCYSVYVDEDYRVGLTQSVAKEYSYDMSLLRETAINNTVKKYPVNLRKLKDIIHEETPEEAPDIYVLTNVTGHKGSSALYYPGVPEMIEKEIGGGYFALPSSIHEYIIVPECAGIPPEELKSFVGKINDDMVDPADQFGTDVLHYDSKVGELVTAC